MKYEEIVDQISLIHFAAQAATARAANQPLTLRNWLIGTYIFEYEQQGEDRAKYGDKLLDTMATEFSRLEMRVLSKTNLKYYLEFALAYPLLGIGQPLADQFGLLPARKAAGAVFSTLAAMVAGRTGIAATQEKQ